MRISLMVMATLLIASCSAFQPYHNAREPVAREAGQENWPIVMLVQYPEGFVLINAVGTNASVADQMNAAKNINFRREALLDPNDLNTIRIRDHIGRQSVNFAISDIKVEENKRYILYYTVSGQNNEIKVDLVDEETGVAVPYTLGR